MAKLDRVSLRLDTFDVEISSRGEVLGHGVLQVNRLNPATYHLEASVAAGPNCLPLGLSRSSKYSAEMKIYKYGGNATDPDTYRFAATMERTDLASDCVREILSPAKAEKMMRLRRGQDVELGGDNDFRVTIHRR